jgi:hypothetical protein
MGRPGNAIAEVAGQLASSTGEDFEKLDRQLLVALREQYDESLQKIFERVGSRPRAYCTELDYYRVERQLLPLLHLGAALSLSPNLVEDYAGAFVEGCALPATVVNHWLDDGIGGRGTGASLLLLSSVGAEAAVAALPSSARVAEVLGTAYRQSVTDMLDEYHARWVVPSDQYCRDVVQSLADLSTTRYYRAPGGYFTAVVCGPVEIAGIDSAAFLPATHAFGVASQLADEVIGLPDDIAKGLVTYSVLSVFDQETADSLRRIWAGTEPSTCLVTSKRVSVGVGNALETAGRWQAAAEQRFAGLRERYSFVPALLPFLYWQRGRLARLRADPHAPHLGDYRHLPPLAVIEAVASPAE